jgi:hypothetical protein
MTSATTPDPGQRISTAPQAGARGTSGWVAWIGFAAVMLVLIGTLHIFEGIAALLNGSYFTVRGSGLLLHMDLTAWAWVHIRVGVVLLVTAVGVFGGWVWARAIGTLVAMLSALVNAASLSTQPVWSSIMIIVAVLVVLALTVHGGEIRGGEDS